MEASTCSTHLHLTGGAGKPAPRASSLCLGWLGTIADIQSGTLLWTGCAAREADDMGESRSPGQAIPGPEGPAGQCGGNTP